MMVDPGMLLGDHKLELTYWSATILMNAGTLLKNLAKS